MDVWTQARQTMEQFFSRKILSAENGIGELKKEPADYKPIVGGTRSGIKILLLYRRVIRGVRGGPIIIKMRVVIKRRELCDWIYILRCELTSAHW